MSKSILRQQKSRPFAGTPAGMRLRQKPTVGNRDGSSTKSNRAPFHWPTYERRAEDAIVSLQLFSGGAFPRKTRVLIGIRTRSVAPFHGITRQLSTQTTLVIIRSAAHSSNRVSATKVPGRNWRWNVAYDFDIELAQTDTISRVSLE